MPPYSRSEIISGLFVVLAVIVFALFAFNIVHIELPFAEPPAAHLRAEFTDAGALDPGDRVIFAGKVVGRVNAIAIRQTPVDLPGAPEGTTRQLLEVRFEINDPELRLDPGTASVAIGKDGLLGRNYISLDPGNIPPGTPLLIAAANATEDQPLTLPATDAQHLDAVIAQAGPIMAKVDAILSRIDQRILADQNLEQIDQTLASLQQAAGNVRRFLDRQDPDGAHALIVKPANTLLLRADKAVDELHQRLIQTTLTEAERLLKEGSATAQAIRERAEKVSPAAVEALNNLAEAAKTIDQRVDQVAVDASELLRLSKTVIAENRPEVAEAVRRLRRSMFEAELALRKIRANPARIVFGDDEKLFDSDQTDAGWLIRTGRAQPYEQRDEN